MCDSTLAENIGTTNDDRLSNGVGDDWQLQNKSRFYMYANPCIAASVDYFNHPEVAGASVKL